MVNPEDSVSIGRPDMPLHTEPEIPDNSPVVLAHIIAEAIRDLSDNSHQHVWDILSVWDPRLTNPRVDPITIVLLRCKQCNLPETMELDGIWTLELLTAKTSKLKPRAN